MLQCLAYLFFCPCSGCIVLDTVNCSPEAGRTTPRDEAALDSLEKIMEGGVPR